MSNADALSLAVENLNRNDPAKAEDLCVAVLRDAPGNAKAWFLCGISHAMRDDLEKAVECFRNATGHDSENAVYHYNLGLAYKKLGQLDRAVDSYRKAIAIKGNFLEARNNLGNVLMEQGAESEAIQCFRELVERFPESGDSHYNLANLLKDTGDVDESVAHYRLALEFEPDCTSARENLGRCLIDHGRVEDAKQVWTDWLAHDPGNAVARHMLAAISGDDVPGRCEDTYIRETFDESFARTFDAQLARLQYRAPELVSEALKSAGREMTDLDVLDAGCGTGLCGPLIRSAARKLVGVDLSEDMLVEARKRDIYDEVVASEITEYMTSHARSFDVVISADTLCYFGDLSQVLRAAFECLKDDGRLIFTVESSDESDDDRRYQLQTHGRYCHAERYVTQTLCDVGFSVSDVTHAELRKERGHSVAGLVVTAVRER